MRAPELGAVGGMRERLTAPVLAGRKTATTGLPAEYVEETEGLEFEVECLALPGNDEDRVTTIEITGVELTSFGGAIWEHATAEGGGGRSLDEWRTGHRRFREDIGTPVDENTPLVCLRFRLSSPCAGT
ncbi:ASCH domain-containing protein [Streptomyces sp. SAI-229]|jgi:uncharacterized protein YhfF|uniref:ASCH domain-containing protein n=1 Tax=Streptomyces sp. SAI-229 TaxID=3377731 RepID=UPI003C7B3C31